jgi:hypothetical protein
MELDKIRAAHAECEALVTPATVRNRLGFDVAVTRLPGSWTAARNEFWRRLPTVEARQRLERWVFAETESGCHATELPPLRREAA